MSFQLGLLLINELISCIDWLHMLFLTCIRSSQGAGTEEACLIDILASRSNAEVNAINAFYKKRKRDIR